MNLINLSIPYIAPSWDGTYIDGTDGLHHCAVCDEVVEKEVPLFGVQRVACRCRLNAIADAKKEREEFSARRAALEHRQAAGIPARYQYARLDDLPSSYAADACARFVATLDARLKDGRGLVLLGPPGVGKTFTACAVLHAVLAQGRSAFFATANDLVRKRSWDEETAFGDSLRRADVLVLDDFATTRTTDYAREKVFEAINCRYNAKKPTLITSNLTVDALKHPGDPEAERLYSRVLEACAPVQMVGENRRVAS